MGIRATSARVLAIGTIAAGLALGGCGSSTETFVGPSGTRCAVQVQSPTTSYGASGGTGTLRVSANRECEWSAHADAAWLTLQPEPAGQGDGTVQFTVAANTDPAARTGGITVSDQRLQIAQEGSPCRFRLSSTRETVDSAGGQRTVRVESSSAQCKWSADADVPWISIEAGRTGSGNGEVVYEIEAVVGPPRTGTITVAGEKLEVEQGTGCVYTPAVTSISAGAAGGTFEVPLAAPAGCTWKAETDAGWITVVSGSSGVGTAIVVVRVAPTDGPSRTAALVAAGRTVTVTQSSGCAIRLEPPSLAVPAAGGGASVSVQSNPACAWSAASSVPWFALTSSAAGTGAGQVTFTAAANTGPARSGTVAIGGQTIPVSQASGCTYSLSPGSVDLSPVSQASAVAVATAPGCPWSAASQAEWVVGLSPGSGAGPGQVTFGVSTNGGPPRSATLTVAGHPFVVNQAAQCTWTLSPSSYEFDANGGRGFVLATVSAKCSWTAASTVTWITIETGASGTGDGWIQFLVAPNPGAARAGNITIGHLDYLVKQAGR